MKIDQLKNALRHMIREEVQKSVAEEVQKAMGRVLVEMVREIKTTDKQKLMEEIEEEEPLKEVIHTKNPKLNNVLAETARRSKNFPKPDVSGLAELMGGSFEKIGANENSEISKPPSNMDFLKQMVGSSGTTNVPIAPSTPSVLDYQDEIPEALQGVFKKDFRSTIKKLDEIKKNGGSGLIMPSHIISG